MVQSASGPAIEPAELAWNDGIPESTQFGDVYFSRDNGLEETRYVFLDHNNLADRFASIEHGSHFVVAETGFGTGLNFLAAWQLWRESVTDSDAILHFVSAERYPLTLKDLTRALAAWPELAPLAEELCDHYPPLTRGVHRIVLDGGSVRLTLFFGDVLDAWNQLSFTADAWFLDGFAPSLNPEMWLDQAITLIRSHSAPGTTLATFTAVGRIRRALADAGFTMRKTAGYGRKRDMLTGVLDDAGTAMRAGHNAPVAIVGSGISGCLLARNLAGRGIRVTLIDAADRAGAAASGNLQGALYVKLGVEFNDQTELGLTALLFSQRFYQPFSENFWHPSGLLQLAYDDSEADRQRRFICRNHYPEDILKPVDQSEASRLSGVTTQSGGLWFPACGWLEPANACEVLSEHPLIEKRFGCRISSLTHQGKQWRLRDHQGGEIAAERVVLCTGHSSADLIPYEGDIRLKPIRGQVTHLPAESLNSPDSVICGKRYLNPFNGDCAVTGATFDLRDDNPNQSMESHRENLTELSNMIPGVIDTGYLSPDGAERVDGRVGFRCTTHDYQPVADALENQPNGLYLFTGLGSKGLTYAPVLAEYLADRLTGQPACLPKKLARRVNAQRILR
ncbi:MAG: bifunctional tRNA (5-methylaminomethyl-2-thiouridine)(34)-methyltransferase MnmD/FAD-dependent 5-carboxymethylaminomethyl-2-thiouridine(34) oxidoreductase MnmC [Gammaproteobacteria bacterium]|nr:MAG: bifunctional tRNA (5-methylaminomethyl-2-thiouridine)(34)-methyltransferase MnmD/FAD-dependent 5-carboxymethylaminomethyl-2-thiouridine(34) oxidoreductase MnmC [Gammaproteobacteria bacterium]